MYSHYEGRSVGRCIHFIRQYLSYHVSEHCTFSDDKVNYGGKVIATIEWEHDIPTFDFVDPRFNQIQAELKSEIVERLREYNAEKEVAPTKYQSFSMVEAVNRINRWVEFRQVPLGSFFIQEYKSQGQEHFLLCVKRDDDSALMLAYQVKDGLSLEGVEGEAAEKNMLAGAMVVPLDYLPFKFARGIHSGNVLLAS